MVLRLQYQQLFYHGSNCEHNTMESHVYGNWGVEYVTTNVALDQSA